MFQLHRNLRVYQINFTETQESTKLLTVSDATCEKLEFNNFQQFVQIFWKFKYFLDYTKGVAIILTFPQGHSEYCCWKVVIN